MLPANNALLATDLILKQIIATHVRSQIVLIAAKELKPVNHVQVGSCLIKAIKIVRNVGLIFITVRNAQEIVTTHNHALNVTKTLPDLIKLKI